MTVRRCPSCAAHVAETAQWCGLCYQRLDLPPEPAGATEAAVPTDGSAILHAGEVPPQARAHRIDAAQARAEVPAEALPGSPQPATGDGGADGQGKPAPTWPCAACGHRVPVELTACPGCGTGFLAQVSQATPVLRLPGVGDVSRLSEPARLALGGGIGVLIAVVLAVILALFS